MPKSLFYGPDEIRKPGAITFEDIPVNTYNKTIEEERARYSDDDLVRIFRDITILREFESMLSQIKTQGMYNGIETTYPRSSFTGTGSCGCGSGIPARQDFIFRKTRSHSEILAKSSPIHDSVMMSL